MLFGVEHPLHRFQMVPKRFKDARVQKLYPNGWIPSVHELAVAYLSNGLTNIEAGIAPFLTGVSNAGKTYAAAAITNNINDAAKRRTDHPVWAAWDKYGFVWAQVNDLFVTLTALQDFRRDAFWQLDNLLRKAPWAVFDDISHLREFERHRELFWVYINHRYEQQLPTLVTANFNVAEGIHILDEAVGEPIRRRLKEMAGDFTLAITGERDG